MAKRNLVMADRRFVATVTKIDGTSYTTTIYGQNPTDAETRAKTADVLTVVVRQELR